jgi:hypothetical protein
MQSLEPYWPINAAGSMAHQGTGLAAARWAATGGVLATAAGDVTLDGSVGAAGIVGSMTEAGSAVGAATRVRKCRP